MNRTYEVIFIVRPDLVDEEADQLVAGFESAANASGATVRKVDKLGRRRLAYRVRGFREGNYVLFELESAGSEPIGELQRRLRIAEPVIKYLAVRTDELEKRLEKRRRHRAARLERRPARPESAGHADDDPAAAMEGRGEGEGDGALAS
ncbi:MAG: 30S ribosomal protein S6 [Acidobacteria bacterium]|nr:MAG: 30S ribosomal protein S6 [Acidobacteriota bacterium]